MGFETIPGESKKLKTRFPHFRALFPAIARAIFFDGYDLIASANKLRPDKLPVNLNSWAETGAHAR
jgi:hypothetical protein